MCHLAALFAALLMCGASATALTEPESMAPFHATAAREHLLEHLRPSVQQDERLDRAAAAIAADLLAGPALAEEGRGFTLARTHLWDAGVSDVAFTFRTIGFGADLDLGAVLDALRDVDPQQGLDTLGVGVAALGDHTRLVVLLSRRDADIELPLAPAENRAPEIRLWLRNGLRQPRVDRIDPAGVVSPLAVTHLDEGVWIAMDRADLAPGLHRLEVFARQGGRERLVAIAAVEEPGAVAAIPDPAAYAHRMLDAERARIGLTTLLWHDALAAVALDHSERLRDGGVAFGHLSPDRPADRISAGGVPHDLALENVARARSMTLAHTLFMASPGHRANVFDPDITHIGVGVARSEPMAWYVTTDFVRLLPPLEISEAERLIRDAIAALREPIRPLQTKRMLDRIAGRWSEQLAGRERLDAVQIEQLTAEVRFHLDDAARVVADVAVIAHPEQITLLAELRHPPFDQYGLGIYQDGSTGMLHVLVILVERKTH